jgi:hypothetical protein
MALIHASPLRLFLVCDTFVLLCTCIPILKPEDFQPPFFVAALQTGAPAILRGIKNNYEGRDEMSRNGVYFQIYPSLHSLVLLNSKLLNNLHSLRKFLKSYRSGLSASY